MPWNLYSLDKLIEAETSILSFIKSKFNLNFVEVLLGESRINLRTISVHNENSRVPLLLLHGMAAGIGFWIMNFDALARFTTVHALDLPGFARSSRYQFASDPEDIVEDYVDSIEKWRLSLGVKRFMLLGHSFGAYISYAYACKYPDNIAHLVLADPWGMATMEEEPPTFRIPIYLKPVVGLVKMFNPLAGLRAFGPLGPGMVSRVRGDIIEKFRPAIGDNDYIVRDYIYQCNAQNPTGESAFYNLCKPLGYARPSFSILSQANRLSSKVPTTIIYGDSTWMTIPGGRRFRDACPANVKIVFVPDSGHHVYADNYPRFNSTVIELILKTQSQETEHVEDQNLDDDLNINLNIS